MELSVDDIIDFIEKEIEISQGKKLSDKEVVDFIERLQTKIAQMDFSVPEGTAMVAYYGWANDCIHAWEVAQGASIKAGDNVTYIGKIKKHLKWKLPFVYRISGEQMAVFSYGLCYSV